MIEFFNLTIKIKCALMLAIKAELMIIIIIIIATIVVVVVVVLSILF